MYDLPEPYGSYSLTPPDDEPETDLPEPGVHAEGERVNWCSDCVECGEPWPCETVEAKSG